MARKLVVEIVGDATSLNRAFKQSSKSASTFGRSVTKTSSVSQRAFGGMARSIAGVSTALLGGAGLAFALRATFAEVQEAQKVAAQTNAVLKSTGGIAGVSARDVDKLATSLSQLSGVDDELIASGENVLLTFTNVRNVMGKGNDIFDQATRAALNMSTALGTDLQGSVIRIGKALQDPVRGVTALRRVGVNFSKDQEKVIKALVESGQTLEAQKLILRELKVEFEGSAEAAGNTLAGKLGKLRESALNLAGSLAATLLPAITPIVDKLVAWLQNTENQQRVMADFKQIVGAVSDVLNILRAAFSALNDVTGSTRNTLKLLLATLVAYKTLALISTLAGIASNIALIGTNAKTATGRVRLLSLALSGIGIGAIAAAGTALVILEQKAIAAADAVREAQDATFKRGEGVETTLVPALAKQIEAMRKAGKSGKEIIETLRKQLGGSLKADDLIAEAFTFSTGSDAKLVARIKKQVRDRAKKAAEAIGAEAPGAVAQALRDQARRLRAAREAARQEAQERAAFAVERAGATETLADDLAALNRYNALLKKRIRGGHATLELEREQFQVQQQIADVLKQQAEKRAEQRETRQFRVLGFGPGGADLVPTAATLRKQLGKAEQALQGTFLDTKKTRSLVARIRKVLADGVGGISEDVRRTIQGLIDDLRQMQDKSRIDLDRWQTAGRGQFVFAATGASRPINVNVQIDGKTVAKATARHNENEMGKRHKQRSHSRRTR